MTPIRQRTLYAQRRAAKQCTKCGTPCVRALCADCMPRRYSGFVTRAELNAFIADDRREEFLALSEISALHRVGGLRCE